MSVYEFVYRHKTSSNSHCKGTIVDWSNYDLGSKKVLWSVDTDDGYEEIIFLAVIF